ncbi:MAG: hypothetical protein J0M00_20115 [Burkholderiales bacterium]|nr:hypothetical protein [Burkholderiales bacterium]
MSIPTKDRDGNDLDLASKPIGGVEFPLNIITRPDGTEVDPASEDTLLLLAGLLDTLQTTVAALNAKTTAVNTGAVAGTVEVSNFAELTGLPVSFTWSGLTDTQLRASALAVTVDDLPLPTGAATETTLASLAAAVKAEDSASADGDPGVVILAQRRDSDTTAVGSDGDYGTLKTDEAGRLKVSTQPASYSPFTGNITANGQTVAANCERFSNLMIHCTGTFSTVNVTFEGSLNSTNGTDGTWFTVQAIRSNANTIETTSGNLSAAPAYAWELSVNGLKWFRVRATAFTSGTQAWTMLPGTYATEPIPGAQISGTQPVSGSLTSAGTTTNTPVTPTQTFTNSAASTNATSTKASAGTVWSIVANNINAAVRYLKLYNKASAPVVGTDTPVLTIPIPAGGLAQVDGGSNGIRFGTGIAWALTASAADSATDAVAAGDIKVAIAYT